MTTEDYAGFWGALCWFLAGRGTALGTFAAYLLVFSVPLWILMAGAYLLGGRP